MNNSINLFLIMTLPWFVVIAATYYFLVREQKIRDESTVPTLGTVVGYAYSNEAKPPKVEYYVDGKIYRKALQYEVVTVVSSPFGKINAETRDNLLDKKIKISRNSAFSVTNFMKEAFPIGTPMTVWYNPENPRLAYVERYAGLYKTLKYGILFEILLLVGCDILFFIIYNTAGV